ncbi:MAG: DNA-processing protein DprA, partial [Pacificimonas sp.]
MADGLAAERLARLRLCRTERVGPVTYRQLMARFGSAAAALDALPGLARRGGKALTPFPMARAANEMDAAEAAGAEMIFVGERAYPEPLAQTESAPPVLTVRGDPSLLQRRCVAIVGARNSSAAAIRFTRELAADLA